MSNRVDDTVTAFELHRLLADSAPDLVLADFPADDAYDLDLTVIMVMEAEAGDE